jgi:ABC-type antimicrobial peptide transport system permease subunit
MFYLAYLRSELLRRRARTILTLLALAVGVALVIAISMRDGRIFSGNGRLLQMDEAAVESEVR